MFCFYLLEAMFGKDREEDLSPAGFKDLLEKT